MAARWQKQEINTFTTVLSLPCIQFHNLGCNRPRSDLKRNCRVSTCDLLSVDTSGLWLLMCLLIFFHTVCDFSADELTEMKQMQPQTLAKLFLKHGALVPFWRCLRCVKVRNDLNFPLTFIRRSSKVLLQRQMNACLLKITHSENTQWGDRCFYQPNMPKYIYCGVATSWGSEQCFSNVPARTGARAWIGHSQLQALSAKQLFGIRCEPRVSIRGSANSTD